MYKVNETVDDSGKEVLEIKFDEPHQAILAEFLMTDARFLYDSIMGEIDRILNQDLNLIVSNGNRFKLLIKQDHTQLSDLWEGVAEGQALQSLTIDTRELREWMVIWNDYIKEFKTKIAKQLLKKDVT